MYDFVIRRQKNDGLLYRNIKDTSILYMAIMSTLESAIVRIRKKIQKSSGCSYLYHYFDELVSYLEQVGNKQTQQETNELIELIDDYARDSRYNNYGSANWMIYSARCFDCADYLVRYIPDDSMKRNVTYFLNSYFVELVEHGVAPIISHDTLCKYISLNLNSENYTDLYDKLIHKAISECGKCRWRRDDEISLALKYTNAINYLIRWYIDKYLDYSMLKNWLPHLETAKLAKFWYDYEDCANYDHTRLHERESIIETSDKMLDIHLGLFKLWYQYDLQEVLECLSLEDIIEILEVSEDDEFKNVLNKLIILPSNDKVEAILKHFCDDDEAWVQRMARNLLTQYLL